VSSVNCDRCWCID